MKTLVLAALALVSPCLLWGDAASAPASPAAQAQSADPWAKFKHLNFEEAKDLYGQNRVLFLDSRPKSEFDQSHIRGAIPLPLGEFDKYYAMYKVRIEKSKKLVSYCHGIGCHLSDKVAEKLYDKGHKNAYVFFGGWPQWTQNNMPIEDGSGKAINASGK